MSLDEYISCRSTVRRFSFQLGDARELSIPSIFAYVEGMPVIVNQNKYLGLKVANGSEFVAMGIVPDANVQEHVLADSGRVMAPVAEAPNSYAAGTFLNVFHFSR
jgi:hypothetical protein